jgi:hypothetical protein
VNYVATVLASCGIHINLLLCADKNFCWFGHSNHQRKYDPNYQRQMDPKGDDSTIRSYETGSNKEICLATQVRLSRWYRAGPDGRQHLNKFSLALPGGVHPTQFYSLAV